MRSRSRYIPICSRSKKDTQDIENLKKNDKKCVDEGKQKYFNRHMVTLVEIILMREKRDLIRRGAL